MGKIRLAPVGMRFIPVFIPFRSSTCRTNLSIHSMIAAEILLALYRVNWISNTAVEVTKGSLGETTLSLPCVSTLRSGGGGAGPGRNGGSCRYVEFLYISWDSFESYPPGAK